MLNEHAHRQISNLIEKRLPSSSSVRRFKQLLQEGWSAESILRDLLSPIAAEGYAMQIGAAIDALWPGRAGSMPNELDVLIESRYRMRLDYECAKDKARCETEDVWIWDDLIVQGYMSKNVDMDPDTLLPSLSVSGEMLLLFLFSTRVPRIIDSDPPIVQIERAVQEAAQNVEKTNSVQFVVDSVRLNVGSIIVDIVLESIRVISDVAVDNAIERVGNEAWAAKAFVEGALNEFGSQCIQRITEIFRNWKGGTPATLPATLRSDAPMIATAPTQVITSWFTFARERAQEIAESHRCKPKLKIDEEGRSQAGKVYFIYRFRGQRCEAKGVVIVLQRNPQDNAQSIYTLHTKVF